VTVRGGAHRTLRLASAAVLLAIAAPAPALTLTGHYDASTATAQLDLGFTETFVDVVSLRFFLDHSPGLGIPAVQPVLGTDPPLANLTGLYTISQLRVSDTRDVLVYSFLFGGEPTLSSAALTWSFGAPVGTTLPLEFSGGVQVEGGLSIAPHYLESRVSNPVVLSIPEPSTWLLLLAGLTTLWAMTPRRPAA